MNKNIEKLAIILISTMCLLSCKSEQEKISDLFDLKKEEAVVVSYYADSVPQMVNYYTKESIADHKEIVGQLSYYPTQEEYMGGRMKEGKRDGVWKAYFPDGVLQSEANYLEGKLNGDYKIFQNDGTLIYRQYYEKGICSGVWEFYDKNGQLEKKIEVTEKDAMCRGCSKCKKITNSK